MIEQQIEQTTPKAIAEHENSKLLDNEGLSLAYGKQDAAVSKPLQLHPKHSHAREQSSAHKHSGQAHLQHPKERESNGSYKLPDNTVAKNRLGTGEHPFYTTVDKQQRNYELHLPKHYDASGAKPVPVFYVLPGVSENVQDMKESTNLNALADKKGFAVVYLEALPKALGRTAWNMEHGALSPKNAGYDDLNYITTVKAQVDQMVSVDRRREYIVGHSEGGQAAQYVANRMPGVFAGIGGIKSTRLPEDPLPRANDPTAAVFVFGQNDQTLPLSGGTHLLPIGLAVPFVFNSHPQEQVDVFARANQCRGGTTNDTSLARTIQYSCALAPVTQIFQFNSGHSWNDQAGTTSTVVNALLKYQKPRK